MAAPALVVSRWSAPHPKPAPLPEAIGPFYQSVSSPFGERFSSDEQHHRIVVERALGHVALGSFGHGAGDFNRPRGLALLQATTRAATRLFVCDALNHRVQVFDGDGDFVMAFGRRGNTPGLFEEPSAIAIVRPELPGDEDIAAADREPWLAIADAGTGRIQLFTIDGVFVAVCAAGRSRLAATGTMGVQAPAGATSLAWKAPYLVSECEGVATEMIHVAGCLDPSAAPAPAPEPPTWRRGLRLVAGAGR